MIWRDDLMEGASLLMSTLCGLSLMREITESYHRLDRKTYQSRSVNFSSLKPVEQNRTISNRCRLIYHDLNRCFSAFSKPNDNFKRTVDKNFKRRDEILNYVNKPTSPL